MDGGGGREWVNERDLRFAWRDKKLGGIRHVRRVRRVRAEAFGHFDGDPSPTKTPDDALNRSCVVFRRLINRNVNRFLSFCFFFLSINYIRRFLSTHIHTYILYIFFKQL